MNQPPIQPPIQPPPRNQPLHQQPPIQPPTINQPQYQQPPIYQQQNLRQNPNQNYQQLHYNLNQYQQHPMQNPTSHEVVINALLEDLQREQMINQTNRMYAQVPRVQQAQSIGTIPLPTFSGHRDPMSPTDFLAAFTRYARSVQVSPHAILVSHMPVALLHDAGVWWDFHDGFVDRGDFSNAFMREYGPSDYADTLCRELNQRTQHADESLTAYIQVIDQYYKKIIAMFLKRLKLVESSVRCTLSLDALYMVGIIQV
jgi:hypothetical protein